MTANAFMSGSLEPPLCVVSVAKRAHMHAHLAAAGRFSSIFSPPARRTSPPISPAGRCPASSSALDRHRRRAGACGERRGGGIAADVAATHDCGDHTIFVGHVVSMNADDRPPLLYHASRFASLVTLREASPAVRRVLVAGHGDERLRLSGSAGPRGLRQRDGGASPAKRRRGSASPARSSSRRLSRRARPSASPACSARPAAPSSPAPACTRPSR